MNTIGRGNFGYVSLVRKKEEDGETRKEGKGKKKEKINYALKKIYKESIQSNKQVE